MPVFLIWDHTWRTTRPLHMLFRSPSPSSCFHHASPTLSPSLPMVSPRSASPALSSRTRITSLAVISLASRLLHRWILGPALDIQRCSISVMKEHVKPNVLFNQLTLMCVCVCFVCFCFCFESLECSSSAWTSSEYLRPSPEPGRCVKRRKERRGKAVPTKSKVHAQSREAKQREKEVIQTAKPRPKI